MLETSLDRAGAFARAFNALAWGPATLVALLAVGLVLTVVLRGLQVRRFVEAWRKLFPQGGAARPEGVVSPFAALMTAISSTVGVSNLAGVPVAIVLGGPGALFWMWMTAIVGMASKYAEAVLALRYRERLADGSYRGGPMSYMERGLGPKWRPLALVYAGFGMIVAFGTGGYIQSNSVADALKTSFGAPPVLVGGVLTALAAVVMLGGIKRIARVAARLTPFAACLYVSLGLVVLVLNAPAIPAAFALIVKSAFGFEAAGGGFAGAAFAAAVRYGVARGVFSNEAGQGTASIAHAQAQAESPHAQGLVAMLGCFIDTLMVCTITGLVIITTGVTGDTGAGLTIKAFDTAFPGLGVLAVSLPLVIFGFSTIFGWTYYGERCCAYVLGEGAVRGYRVAALIITFLGAAVLQLESAGFGGMVDAVTVLWLMADGFTAFMVAPNLVALIALAPVVVRTYREATATR